MNVGILENETDEPVGMPAEFIDQAMARVLSVYVDDNERKLRSLDIISARIILFKELVESRFSSKSLSGIITFSDRAFGS